MLSRFKRITSSGNYIPEIDGLRFIAITSVVLYHLNIFLINKDSNIYLDTIHYSFLNKLLSNGHVGVPIFFTISGFILALPFAKHYLKNEKKVNLKHFFLRRLTRIEPPYILTLTIFFIGVVLFTNNLSSTEAISSYFASLFYTHNIIYPRILPKINAATWSLEVEIQFYLLTPILCKFFSIKHNTQRRTLIIIVILILLITNHLYKTTFVSLLNYLHYFLAGFLLVDLYIGNYRIFSKTKYDNLFCLTFFTALFYSNEFAPIYYINAIKLITIFFGCYYVIFHNVLKVLILKIPLILGGMCYSLYLIHYQIFSLFGNTLLKYQVSQYSFINGLFYSLTLLFLVIIITSVFFLTIEKPCMNPNWPNKIYTFFKKKYYPIKNQ